MSFLFSAVISAMLGHVVDTAVILAVVVINAAIGVVQEGPSGERDSVLSFLRARSFPAICCWRRAIASPPMG